jgi:hypothetical protein
MVMANRKKMSRIKRPNRDGNQTKIRTDMNNSRNRRARSRDRLSESVILSTRMVSKLHNIKVVGKLHRAKVPSQNNLDLVMSRIASRGKGTGEILPAFVRLRRRTIQAVDLARITI